MDSFSLTTSLAYSPPDSFSLLHRHYARLATAHAQLAQQLPGSWCNTTPLPANKDLLAELRRAVRQAGEDKQLRVRLNIQEDGRPFAEAFPLVPMPSYPVRLVFDDTPTSYSDPFLRYKTTRRDKYDTARERHGATLHASSDSSEPPFDVILFNAQGELTETTIANIAFRLDASASPVWVTPKTACGLLEGVQRAKLLDKEEVVEGVVTLEEAKRAVEAGTLEIICFNGVRGVYKAVVEKV